MGNALGNIIDPLSFESELLQLTTKRNILEVLTKFFMIPLTSKTALQEQSIVGLTLVAIFVTTSLVSFLYQATAVDLF